MSKDSTDSIGVVHRQVEAGDCAVAPAHDSDSRDVQVVQQCNRVAGNVVVVERGEILVRTPTLAASTGHHGEVRNKARL